MRLQVIKEVCFHEMEGFIPSTTESPQSKGGPQDQHSSMSCVFPLSADVLAIVVIVSASEILQTFPNICVIFNMKAVSAESPGTDWQHVNAPNLLQLGSNSN